MHLVGHATLVVVRVLVPLAVSHRLHQSRRRIAQVHRDGLVARLLDELARGAIRSQSGVRLGRQRQVERRLGERQHRLRHADKMRRLLRRHRDGKRMRVGQAHVLSREDDEAPRHEQRVLARLEHPRHPVHGSVGIAAAHAFDQRRDDVVMLVPRAVVQQVALLQRGLDMLHRNRNTSRERG